MCLRALVSNFLQTFQPSLSTSTITNLNLNMASDNTPTLLGLPAELRNEIWKLVVFHEVTDGVISPLQDEDEGYSWGNDTSQGLRRRPVVSLIYACGERFRLLDHEPLSHHAQGRPANPAEKAAQDAEIDRYYAVWEKTANNISGHYCKLSCLLQPRITHVNRQVRAESLSMFYHINKIHIELGNFVLPRKGPGKNVKIPADWWRAIGNHNLKFVANFNIFGQCFRAFSEKGNMIKYRNSRELKATMTKSPYSRTPPPSGSFAGRHAGLSVQDYQAGREIDLWRALKNVEVDGLSVEILERITALLEPPDKKYLRDDGMLRGL